MRLFRGSAAPGWGRGRGGGGELWGWRLAGVGAACFFSSPRSCCAGFGGVCTPAAGFAGALIAYSLKWETRTLRNAECAAGAQVCVCPRTRPCAAAPTSAPPPGGPGAPGRAGGRPGQPRPGGLSRSFPAATCSRSGQAGSAPHPRLCPIPPYPHTHPVFIGLERDVNSDNSFLDR